MTRMIPNITPGTYAEQDTDSALQAFLGRRVYINDPIFGTADQTEMKYVRVTKAGGLLPNRPWALSADGTEATDYADGSGDYNVGIPDPLLDATVTVPENAICYVVTRGFAKCQVVKGGVTSTGVPAGSLVTIDTTGDGADCGLTVDATISGATIGRALNTLAADTDGDIKLYVWPRN